jgi:hypothetical protein
MTPPDDCVAKYTGLLSDYLKEQYPGAKGDSMRTALQDPIAYNLVEAQIGCRFKAGDTRYADILRDEFLSMHEENRRVVSAHDAIFVLLSSGVPGSTGGSGASMAAGAVYLIGAREPDYFWKVQGIGKPGFPKDPKPFEVNGNMRKQTFDTFDDVVGGIENQGEKVLLSFKPHKEKVKYGANCATSKTEIASWDQWGHPQYKEYCDIKTGEITVQSEAVRIPAADAVAVKPGVRVAVVKRDPAAKAPSDAILVWAQKGEDYVWAAGVPAP